MAARLGVSDGDVRWKTPNPAGVPVIGMDLAGLTDDTVIAYRVTHRKSAGDEVYDIAGLRADDGRKKWTVELSDASYALRGTRAKGAVVHDGTVLTAGRDGTRMEARNADTGKVLWTEPFPEGETCVPVLVGDRPHALCAPAREAADFHITHLGIHELDPDSGRFVRGSRLKGTLRLVGDADGAPVFIQERYTDEGALSSMRAVTVDLRGAAGSRSYRWTCSPGVRWNSRRPLYFTEGNGKITAVALRTGSGPVVEDNSLEGASGPAVSGDSLYFSSATGRVLALDRRTGKELWLTRPRAGGALTLPDRSPRMLTVGRALYVSAADNTLFTLDARHASRGGR